MRRANRRQVERRSLELRYAKEHATSPSLDESFGSVGNASEPEEKRATSLESNAAPRPRDTCRRSRKGGKGGSACPRQQRRAGEQVNDLEKQLAAVRLGSPASSEGSSIDARDFASPSGKASSLESARVRAGSYHLGADAVSTRYDSQRAANQIGKRKLARVEKKCRGE